VRLYTQQEFEQEKAKKIEPALAGTRIWRLVTEAPESGLCDDVSAATSFVGVGGDGFVGFKVHVA
jgi:hypothetical protein